MTQGSSKSEILIIVTVELTEHKQIVSLRYTVSTVIRVGSSLKKSGCREQPKNSLRLYSPLRGKRKVSRDSSTVIIIVEVHKSTLLNRGRSNLEREPTRKFSPSSTKDNRGPTYCCSTIRLRSRVKSKGMLFNTLISHSTYHPPRVFWV